MPYTPHTDLDIQEMLQLIGLSSIEDLFEEIPESIRKPSIQVQAPKTEEEIRRVIDHLSGLNHPAGESISFLGGGAYERIRPSIIDRLISRSEFCTSYTPYQAEVSQGTLQFIFEFQSLITRLTGMEATNASMYDGASALAEAALMALRINHRGKLLVAGSIHPRWKQALKTYLTGMDAVIEEIPMKSGTLDLEWLAGAVDSQTSSVARKLPGSGAPISPSVSCSPSGCRFLMADLTRGISRCVIKISARCREGWLEKRSIRMGSLDMS